MNNEHLIAEAIKDSPRISITYDPPRIEFAISVTKGPVLVFDGETGEVSWDDKVLGSDPAIFQSIKDFVTLCGVSNACISPRDLKKAYDTRVFDVIDDVFAHESAITKLIATKLKERIGDLK